MKQNCGISALPILRIALVSLLFLAMAWAGTVLAVPEGNRLTFTFDSNEHPWTQQEKDTIASLLSAFQEKAVEIYGPPFEAITINVAKDPNIGHAGIYDYRNNTIKLSTWPLLRLSTLCHEMIHAFHGKNMLAKSWEEGMTRAATIEVFARMEGFQHGDPAHKFELYYENYSLPTTSYHQFSTLKDGYFMWAMGWAKCFLEDSLFFAKLNASLYRKIYQDMNRVNYRVDSLVATAAEVLPRVEGIPFVQWYNQQGIFDRFPARDSFLFFVDYTKSAHPCVSCSGRRIWLGIGSPSGAPKKAGHTRIFWEILNHKNQPLGNGVVENINVSPKTGDTLPTMTKTVVFSAPPSLTGRITTRVWVENARAPSLKSKPTRWDTVDSGPLEAFQYALAGPQVGLFGVVEKSQQGSVTVTHLNTGRAYTKSVTHGGYAFPELDTIRGRFELVFTDSKGGVWKKRINKDASAYFALVPESVPSHARYATPTAARPFPYPLLTPVSNPLGPQSRFVVRNLSGPATFVIRNARGAMVFKTIVRPSAPAVAWSTSAVPSGIYLLSVKAGSARIMRKLVVTK